MQKVFRVYDSKAEAYLQPFMAMATGAGIRAFIEAAETENHQFSKHSEDYTLFEVGVDDEISGVTEYYEAKKALGTAQELAGGAGAAEKKDINAYHQGKTLPPVVRGGE